MIYWIISFSFIIGLISWFFRLASNRYRGPIIDFRQIFKLPKHHNFITTIIRILVFLLGIFILGLIFVLSREIIPKYGDFVRDELRKNASYSPKKALDISTKIGLITGLIESIRFAVIFWPLTPFIMRLTRRIKIGQHYIKRNKKIKKIIGIDSNNTDYINEIEKLSSLKDKGIITDEEFQAKKKELLGL